MYDTKEKCRELAEKFKQLCAERGTTPYKIARHSGLSSSTVSCFLTGKTVPRIDTMMILCNQLGISITDIFDEREMVEVHAQEEELILHTYRNLPEDKKKAVLEYLKMLDRYTDCLLYTSPSPRDSTSSRMPSSA